MTGLFVTSRGQASVEEGGLLGREGDWAQAPRNGFVVTRRGEMILLRGDECVSGA
jgi:hypothetical protein